jgi:hypothetical protein
MLDLTRETPIPLAAATKLVPPGRNGKRTHFSTLLRWILQGVKSPSGELVRLEGARLGHRWFTTCEAIQRFSDRLTPNFEAEAVPAPRTPTQRERATARAQERIAEAGI